MNKRIIISGGGTGGHIFPAISIANALKQKDSSIEILFVGAEGRMEMEKVPAAGYAIEGLPVAGIQRSLSLKNLKVPFKLWNSLRKASQIIKKFKPDVVVGVGGYASAPVLWAAQNKGIPTLIQEQNSYAGVTNKLLARRAKKVCVAYDNMERFFKQEKIIFTGNPVRQDLQNIAQLRQDALSFFELDPGKKTILIVGGSLGARTINRTILQYLKEIIACADVQFIWQTGKFYINEVTEKIKSFDAPNVKVMPFIQRMDYAFAAADLVISRAGAGTISELCVVKKPCILVPSPNVAEDHQTANARALEQKGAALMVSDVEAVNTLIPLALETIGNQNKLEELSKNIEKLAHQNAAQEIAERVLEINN